MPVGWRKDERTVVHPDNEILFCDTKEVSSQAMEGHRGALNHVTK